MELNLSIVGAWHMTYVAGWWSITLVAKIRPMTHETNSCTKYTQRRPNNKSCSRDRTEQTNNQCQQGIHRFLIKNKLILHWDWSAICCLEYNSYDLWNVVRLWNSRICPPLPPMAPTTATVWTRVVAAESWCVTMLCHFRCNLVEDTIFQRWRC